MRKGAFEIDNFFFETEKWPPYFFRTGFSLILRLSLDCNAIIDYFCIYFYCVYLCIYYNVYYLCLCIKTTVNVFRFGTMCLRP